MGAVRSDAVMTQICAEVKNYFVRTASDIFRGTFAVSGGVMTLSDAADGRADADFREMFLSGRYIRVIGSVFSDGVHAVQEDGTISAADETFAGEVWLMAPPTDFLLLADDIAAWTEKYGDKVTSPFASESFAGYSYSMRGTSRWRGDNSGSADDFGWQNAFRSRLNKFRRMMV